ncbi:MAG: FecR family protein [Hyphomicrobiales bacterium]
MEIHDIDNIIIRHLCGEASESEEALLSDWLKESKENKKYYKDLKKIWEESQSVGAFTKASFDAEKAWRTIRPYHEKKSRLVFKIIASLAAVAIIFFSVYYYTYYNEGLRNDLIVVSTSKGEEKKITLPDSSHLILKENSILKYHDTFEAKARYVELSGSAFFDVYPLQSNPFIIKTPIINVKVLGTKFLVDNYSKDSAVVKVTEGSVRMYTSETALGYSNGIDLSMGEEGLFVKKEDSFASEPFNISNIDAKEKGILEFKNTPLPLVVKDVEEYFHIKIEIHSARLLNQKFNARFSDPTLEKVFNSIEVSFNCQVIPDSGGYIIK